MHQVSIMIISILLFRLTAENHLMSTINQNLSRVLKCSFQTDPEDLLPEYCHIWEVPNGDMECRRNEICFTHSSTSMKIAPVICYESVFGKFVTDYIKKGAEAMFIITNDGWWKNTNGYKQHLYFASLRAIETRRPVARAANTGVSCMIDIRGKRTIETNWWTKAVIKGEIFPETRITVYVKYGDYLLQISDFFKCRIIIIAVFVGNTGKKKIHTFRLNSATLIISFVFITR